MRILKREDKKLIDEYLKKAEPQISELTFTNLYMWRHAYRYDVVEVLDYLWLVARVDDPFTMIPLGDYKDLDGLKASIEEMKRLLMLDGHILRIERVDKRLVKILESLNLEMEIIEDRDAFDYVYDFEALKNLKGKSYHKKKNHVNKFLKSYPDWDYEEIHDDMLDEMGEAIERWFMGKGKLEDPFANAERKAIHLALEHFDELDFVGGVIRVNGQIEAFTFGEQLNEDTFVVHIEKANTNYSGLYSMINTTFLNVLEKDYKYVNREQDLGIEGLRKSKLSYHPVKMIEKYIVNVL